MFVGAIFRSSTQLANLSKTIVFTTYLHVFTLWKNIMFDTFDDLYHYLLWHCFFDAFGHRFGVLFREQNQCFWAIVFMMLCCLSFL